MEGESTSCRTLNFDESIEEYSQANQGCGDFEVNEDERLMKGIEDPNIEDQFPPLLPTQLSQVTSSTSNFQTAISALDNRLNEEQQRYPPTGYHSLDTTCWIPPAGFFPPGYRPTGYPPSGYPASGYPPFGYPPVGYPPSGYPLFEYPGTSAPHHGGHHGHRKEKHGTS